MAHRLYGGGERFDNRGTPGSSPGHITAGDHHRWQGVHRDRVRSGPRAEAGRHQGTGAGSVCDRGGPAEAPGGHREEVQGTDASGAHVKWADSRQGRPREKRVKRFAKGKTLKCPGFAWAFE